MKNIEQNISEKMITITQEEYNKLLERDKWLSCLESAGVITWSGFSHAKETWEEWDNDI